MPRTRPSALTISVTTRPHPPCRLTSRRNAVSVMPAMGATANGDGNSMSRIFTPGYLALTSAASTCTLTACPIKSTERTSLACEPFRVNRPITPLSGP